MSSHTNPPCRDGQYAMNVVAYSRTARHMFRVRRTGKNFFFSTSTADIKTAKYHVEVARL
jgi:hypothetical protein